MLVEEEFGRFLAAVEIDGAEESADEVGAGAFKGYGTSGETASFFVASLVVFTIADFIVSFLGNFLTGCA